MPWLCFYSSWRVTRRLYVKRSATPSKTSMESGTFAVFVCRCGPDSSSMLENWIMSYGVLSDKEDTLHSGTHHSIVFLLLDTKLSHTCPQVETTTSNVVSVFFGRVNVFISRLRLHVVCSGFFWPVYCPVCWCLSVSTCVPVQDRPVHTWHGVWDHREAADCSDQRAVSEVCGHGHQRAGQHCEAVHTEGTANLTLHTFSLLPASRLSKLSASFEQFNLLLHPFLTRDVTINRMNQWIDLTRSIRLK